MNPISPAHAVLRSATAGHHVAAEEAFAAFDLGTPGGYRDFLLAQAAAVLPVERWLADRAIADVLPDWTARRRGDLLLRDLEALGARPPAWAPADLPGDPFGAVYVLEGSSFGGRVLARRAAAADATRFLRDPGPAGGWRAFWEAVERELDSGRRSLAAMLEAAEAVFALFRVAGLAPADERAPGACPSPMRAGVPRSHRDVLRVASTGPAAGSSSPFAGMGPGRSRSANAGP